MRTATVEEICAQLRESIASFEEIAGALDVPEGNGVVPIPISLVRRTVGDMNGFVAALRKLITALEDRMTPDARLNS